MTNGKLTRDQKPLHLDRIFIGCVIVLCLIASAFVVGYKVAPTSKVVYESALADRADAQAQRFASKEGEVTFFQPNAVVFNYTVGLNHYMARQLSVRFVKDGNDWKLAPDSTQWFKSWTEPLGS